MVDVQEQINLQFVTAPESPQIPEVPVPEWAKIAEKSKDHLQEYIGNQLYEKESINEAIKIERENLKKAPPIMELEKTGGEEAREAKVKKLTGERQRVINEITAGQSGLVDVETWERYFQVMPGLKSERENIKSSITSLQQEINVNQAQGEDIRELEEKINQQREQLKNVEMQMVDILPAAIVAGESYLTRKGFGNIMNYTKDVNRQFLEEAKKMGIETLPELDMFAKIVLEAQAQKDADTEKKIAEAIIDEKPPVDLPVEKTQALVIESNKQGRIDDLRIAYIDAVNNNVEGLNAFRNLSGEDINILITNQIVRPDDSRQLVDIVNKRVRELEPGKSYRELFDKQAKTTPPVERTVYESARDALARTLRPPDRDNPFRAMGYPDITSTPTSTVTAPATAEKKAIPGKVRDVIRKTSRAIVTGALLALLARSSGVGPANALGKTSLAPQPTGQPTQQINKEFLPPPTPTLEIPSTRPPPVEKTPTPTSTITASPTPTVTATSSVPEASETPQPTPTPEMITQKDIVDKFFLTPIEIQGTLWDSIHFPDGMFTNWENPENHVTLDGMLRDIISDIYQPKLALNGENVHNMPDWDEATQTGKKLDLSKDFTDSEKDIFRLAAGTTSLEDSKARFGPVWQQYLLDRANQTAPQGGK